MRGAFNLVGGFGRCGYVEAHYVDCKSLYRYDGSAGGVVKTTFRSKN